MGAGGEPPEAIAYTSMIIEVKDKQVFERDTNRLGKDPNAATAPY